MTSFPLNGSKKPDKHVEVAEIDLESEVGSVKINLNHELKLRRGLERRHVEMLALVGIFGTGLFVSSGATLGLV